MTIIFVCLSIFVLVFLLMICLTLFRVERSVKMTTMLAEKKIIREYGRK
jgi:hypothetical protein